MKNKTTSAERMRAQSERDKKAGIKVRHFRLSQEQLTKYTKMKDSGLNYDEIIDLAYQQFLTRR